MAEEDGVTLETTRFIPKGQKFNIESGGVVYEGESKTVQAGESIETTPITSGAIGKYSPSRKYAGKTSKQWEAETGKVPPGSAYRPGVQVMSDAEWKAVQEQAAGVPTPSVTKPSVFTSGSKAGEVYVDTRGNVTQYLGGGEQRVIGREGKLTSKGTEIKTSGGALVGYLTREVKTVEVAVGQELPGGIKLGQVGAETTHGGVRYVATEPRHLPSTTPSVSSKLSDQVRIFWKNLATGERRIAESTAKLGGDWVKTSEVVSTQQVPSEIAARLGYTATPSQVTVTEQYDIDYFGKLAPEPPAPLIKWETSAKARAAQRAEIKKRLEEAGFTQVTEQKVQTKEGEAMITFTGTQEPPSGELFDVPAFETQLTEAGFKRKGVGFEKGVKIFLPEPIVTTTTTTETITEEKPTPTGFEDFQKELSAFEGDVTFRGGKLSPLNLGEQFGRKLEMYGGWITESATQAQAVYQPFPFVSEKDIRLFTGSFISGLGVFAKPSTHFKGGIIVGEVAKQVTKDPLAVGAGITAGAISAYAGTVSFARDKPVQFIGQTGALAVFIAGGGKAKAATAKPKIQTIVGKAALSEEAFGRLGGDLAYSIGKLTSKGKVVGTRYTFTTEGGYSALLTPARVSARGVSIAKVSGVGILRRTIDIPLTRQRGMHAPVEFGIGEKGLTRIFVEKPTKLPSYYPVKDLSKVDLRFYKHPLREVVKTGQELSRQPLEHYGLLLEKGRIKIGVGEKQFVPWETIEALRKGEKAAKLEFHTHPPKAPLGSIPSMQDVALTQQTLLGRRHFVFGKEGVSVIARRPRKVLQLASRYEKYDLLHALQREGIIKTFEYKEFLRPQVGITAPFIKPPDISPAFGKGWFAFEGIGTTRAITGGKAPLTLIKYKVGGGVEEVLGKRLTARLAKTDPTREFTGFKIEAETGTKLGKTADIRMDITQATLKADDFIPIGQPSDRGVVTVGGTRQQAQQLGRYQYRQLLGEGAGLAVSKQAEIPLAIARAEAFETGVFQGLTLGAVSKGITITTTKAPEARVLTGTTITQQIMQAPRTTDLPSQLRVTTQQRKTLQLRDTKQLRSTAQLRETAQLRGVKQLRETGQLRATKQLRETAQLRSQLRATDQLRITAQLRDTITTTQLRTEEITREITTTKTEVPPTIKTIIIPPIGFGKGIDEEEDEKRKKKKPRKKRFKEEFLPIADLLSKTLREAKTKRPAIQARPSVRKKAFRKTYGLRVPVGKRRRRLKLV